MKKGMLAFMLACIGCAVGLLALAATSSAMASALPNNDYPQEYRGKYGSQAIVDRWRFYACECTSFVAWRLEHDNGVQGFSNGYMGARWGNAKTWKDAAIACGVRVDDTPSVGAVAWSGAGVYGHVAWVAAVDGDSVTVEEYNGLSAYAYGYRTLHKSAFEYIHIQDIAAGAGSPSDTNANVDGSILYAAIIDEYREAVRNGGFMVTGDHVWPIYVFAWEPLSQVSVNLSLQGSASLQQHFGYAFRDLNGDQRPEIILMSQHGAIYAIGTMMDGNAIQWYGMYYPHDGGEVIDYILNADNTLSIDEEAPQSASVETYKLSASGDALELVGAFGYDPDFFSDAEKRIYYRRMDNGINAVLTEAEYRALYANFRAGVVSQENILTYIPLFENRLAEASAVNVGQVARAAAADEYPALEEAYRAVLMEYYREAAADDFEWLYSGGMGVADYAYACCDIDGNGVMELIKKQLGAYAQIFEIYTLVDGVPRMLISAGDRAGALFIGKTGLLWHWGSDGANRPMGTYWRISADGQSCDRLWSIDIVVDENWDGNEEDTSITVTDISGNRVIMAKEEYLQWVVATLPNEAYDDRHGLETTGTLYHQPGEKTIHDALIFKPLAEMIFTGTETGTAPASRSLAIVAADSPTHTGRGTSTYGPLNVLDGAEATSWQYSRNKTGGNGYRMHIVLTLAAPSTVETLCVKNGFWAVTSGVDQYWRNNRVEEATIGFQYAGSDAFADPIAYRFADEKQVASIDLGGRENVIALKFTIESVYRGNKFDDTAITSMEIMGTSAW